MSIQRSIRRNKLRSLGKLMPGIRSRVKNLSSKKLARAQKLFDRKMQKLKMQAVANT